MTRVISVLAIAGIVACSPQLTSTEPPVTDGVSMSAAPESGDMIALTLTNNSGGQVGYNLCHSSLERRSGSGWIEVSSDRACTMELRLLQSGASATNRYAFAPLQKGTYRVRTSIETASGQSVTITSNEFTIS